MTSWPRKTLEEEKQQLIESAAEKDRTMKEKLNMVGNIVHASVPVSNNEVRFPYLPSLIHICLSFAVSLHNLSL